MQRFLARVFDPASTTEWVLKGGTGLAVRLPQARFSRDIDLVRIPRSGRTGSGAENAGDSAAGADDVDMDAALEDMRAAASRPSDDPLEFRVLPPSRPSNPHQLTVEARISGVAGAPFDTFPIDVSTRPATVAGIEQTRPAAAVPSLGFGDLPVFDLYPIAHQAADKICAMFELYGTRRQPSTRYHDLVDLLMILRERPVIGFEVSLAMSAEQARRERLHLPERFAAPSTTWVTGYLGVATRAPLPAELHDLDAAVAAAGRFVDAVLDGTAWGMVWDPAAQTWVPSL